MYIQPINSGSNHSEKKYKIERTIPLVKGQRWGITSYNEFGKHEVIKEIIRLILSNLAPEDLYNARGVCRVWYLLASDLLTLPRLFPKAPVIDKGVWDAHVDLEALNLVFEDISQPHLYYRRDYMELMRMAAEVELNSRVPFGISLLTLPKGLTINKIIAIAKAPKMGNATIFRNISSHLLEKYGDEEIDETVVIAITNGVFKQTRGKLKDDHIVLVKGLQCDMHERVSVMALAIMTFVHSDPNNPLRLFEGTPLNYFEETLGHHIVFGVSSPGSQIVDCSYSINWPDGAGGQRKFKGFFY